MAYIYVMDRDDGCHKIGFSVDPTYRRTQISCARSLIGMWQHDNAPKVERAAHKLLAEWRRDGEWFAVDRYAAFDAIRRALWESDTQKRPVIQPREQFDIPALPLCDGDRHKLGYSRPLNGAPVNQQMQWMLAAGVSDLDLYTEAAGPGAQLEASLKDARDGDLFHVWSAQVFGGLTAAIVARLADKGADLVVAIQ